MANRIGFTDTLTGKETVCGTWAKTTLAVIQLSVSHNVRYLLNKGTAGRAF